MTGLKPSELQSRLLCVLEELEHQQNVGNTYSEKFLSYADEMSQIREFIDVAGEYGLAYEYLVGAIELHPFVLSGKAAIALLELGLTFGFKTEQAEDRVFDRRDLKPT
jgi:hypothetical protein